MLNLPLFNKSKKIQEHFVPDADIVIFTGDVNDFLKEIPDNSVKLIITWLHSLK
jgi:adenine-specific DNA-methyltransferase